MKISLKVTLGVVIIVVFAIMYIWVLKSPVNFFIKALVTCPIVIFLSATVTRYEIRKNKV